MEFIPNQELYPLYSADTSYKLPMDRRTSRYVMAASRGGGKTNMLRDSVFMNAMVYGKSQWEKAEFLREWRRAMGQLEAENGEDSEFPLPGQAS